MTQLVDGNWGVHAIIPKAIFDTGRRRALSSAKPRRALAAAKQLHKQLAYAKSTA